jgi:antitoxin ChpS
MPDGLIDTALAMADIAYDVLLETGIDIQPVPVTEDGWNYPDRHSNPWLVKAIRREGAAL